MSTDKRLAALAERETIKRREQRKHAERGARVVWDKLSKRSSKGREHLASKGILPQGAGKECRFTSRSVCLPLWGEDGIINVVGWRIDGGEPRTCGLAACSTEGTFGRAKLGNTNGAIVITEGLFDYLSARQLKPRRLVLGAFGEENLQHAIKVAAGLLLGDEKKRGIVLIEPQGGYKSNATPRWEEAEKAGVLLTAFRTPEGYADLNDYLCRDMRLGKKF